MFLLTEGPRLFYVDAANMVLKGEIPWLALQYIVVFEWHAFAL